MSDQHNTNEHLRHNATSDDPETIRQHRGINDENQRSAGQTQAGQPNQQNQQSVNQPQSGQTDTANRQSGDQNNADNNRDNHSNRQQS